MMETARRDTAAARREADATAAADRREADASTARHKVWVLRPKDPMEPPFHYAGVTHKVVVIAADEKSARKSAAGSGPEMAPAGFAVRDGQRTAVDARSPWTDETLTTCEELDLTEPGFIARDMRA